MFRFFLPPLEAVIFLWKKSPVTGKSVAFTDYKVQEKNVLSRQLGQTGT